MQVNKDPHHDAYLAELSQFAEPLRAFKNKVAEHLTEWPENAILLRLSELSDKLESVSMSAPLMKWLVGLETLLGKADEWEMVASKEVSLKTEIHELSRFVVKWRKLELESWTMVLDRRQRDARKKTAQWWFHLHELVESAIKDPFWTRKGTSWIAAGSREEIEPSKESLQVFDVLDQFARTSTLGDFSLRCDLLDAFAGYVHVNYPAADALEVTLRNLARYYRQFGKRVQDYLDKSREPIQQKLIEHVKIATWDDRNYFALRESAEKSHRVIHKLARAFDEVLESAAHPAMEQAATEIAIFDTPEALATCPPLQVVVGTENSKKRKRRGKKKSETSMEETPDAPKFSWIEARSMVVPDHESSASQLPLKFERDILGVGRRGAKLIQSRALPSLFERDSTTGQAPLELDEDARLRLKSLTKESPMQLKKRALVDFFSELKRNGVLEGIVPRMVRDSRAILASGLTSVLQTPSIAVGTRWRETEDTLFRCVAQLTRLRQVIASPERSSDLSQDECSRGLRACEKMIWMCLVEREYIGRELAETREGLLQEATRWENLCATENLEEIILFQGDDKLRVALDAIVTGVKDLNFMMKKLAPGESAVDIQAIVKSQQSFVELVQKEVVPKNQLMQFYSDVRAQVSNLVDRVSSVVTRNKIPSCESLITLMENAAVQLVPTSEILESLWKEGEVDATIVVNTFTEYCMLAVQATVQSTSQGNEESENEETKATNSDEGMAHHHDWLCRVLAGMNLTRLLEAMRQVRRAGLPMHDLRACLRLLVPLLDYLHHFTNAFLSFHSSLCKFLQFAVSVFRTLCAKGFCRPPEEEEEGEGGQDENLREGTGIGEGEGKTNVSKEIENEEQVLGLKGDQEQQDEKQEKKEKDDQQQEEDEGMEMENDFEGGDMHDVEQDEEDEEDEPKEGEEEEEEELDREMGDLGEQNNVVDEKLWDSDDDEEKDEQDEQEKFEKDAPMQGRDNEDELRAKDKEDDEDQSKEQKPQEQKPQEKDKKRNEEPSAQEDDDEGENEEGNPKQFEQEEQEDNHDVEAKEQFTDEEEGGEEDENPQEQPPGTEEEHEPEDFDMPPPEADEGKEDQNEMEVENQEGDSQSDSDSDAGSEDDSQENTEIQGPDEMENEQPADDAGKLSMPATQQQEQDEQPPQDENEMDQRGNSQGQDASAAKAEAAENESEAMEQRSEEEPRQQRSGDATGNSGGLGGQRYRKGASQQPDEETQSREPQEQQHSDDTEPNPWRDPGDAAREWNRRLRMVETGADGAEEAGEHDDDADREAGQQEGDLFEFTKRDEEPNADEEDLKQTLGARNENEKDEGSQIKMDEEAQEELKPKQQPQQVPEEEQKRKQDQLREEEKPKSSKKKKKKQGFFDDLEEEEPNDDEEEPPQPPPQSTEEPFHLSKRKDADSHLLYSDRQASKAAPSISEEEEESQHQELQLESVNDLSDEALEQGRKAWREATNATHEMAQRLCEQLRLVLEPTMATKLKGDYRTGKRINMKRVIPFIASQFRKDKIWLRRTKPSRRKYHVALAIDDSKSMLPARHLALAALALISRALTQLEVGEVGIWSFGSKVRKLHDLSQPFGDTAGAQVAGHFGFDQDSTCIEEGLGAVVGALTAAAQATSDKSISDQPRQLAFIVSDGRFDTGLRPRMAKWLRIARERRQLVALIVVEPPGQESILDLKQVSFGTGATMGMKVNRYLEDYPFPYYIVLRDMAVLPEVLADGLRQWFELIVGEDKN